MKCMKKYSDGGKAPKPPKKDVGKLLERLENYQGRVSGLLANLEDAPGPKYTPPIIRMSATYSRSDDAQFRERASSAPAPMTLNQLLTELENRSKNMVQAANERAKRESKIREQKYRAQSIYEYLQNNKHQRIFPELERAMDPFIPNWRETSLNRNFPLKEFRNGPNHLRIEGF